MVKRYVREDGSVDVAKWLRTGARAAARLSWVEVVSAVALRARLGQVSAARVARVSVAVEADASRMLTLELTDAVEAIARRLTVDRALRAGDAVQLAGALVLREQSGRPVVFVCYDAALAVAARAEGLKTLGA